MVDEDLFEAVTLVGGAAKGAVTGIKGIAKLPKGKFKVKLDNGQTAEVPQSAVVQDSSGNIVVRPDYYIRSNGDVIPSTGYRAVSGPGADAAKKGDLMSRNKAGEIQDTYFTFDNPEGKSAALIKSELQIPHTPTYYGEFDTLQIIDDVKIPKEDWGRGTKPEPITNYFGPDHPDGENYGIGGATQAITKTPIKDFELQEIKQ
jgi:hypothetical protein